MRYKQGQIQGVKGCEPSRAWALTTRRVISASGPAGTPPAGGRHVDQLLYARLPVWARSLPNRNGTCDTDG